MKPVKAARLSQDPGFHGVVTASALVPDTSARSSTTASGFTSALRSPGSCPV